MQKINIFVSVLMCMDIGELCLSKDKTYLGRVIKGDNLWIVDENLDYESLMRLSYRASAREILQTIGAHGAYLCVHLSKMGLPFLLLYSAKDNSCLDSFNFIGIQPNADIPGLLYDYKEAKNKVYQGRRVYRNNEHILENLLCFQTPDLNSEYLPNRFRISPEGDALRAGFFEGVRTQVSEVIKTRHSSNHAVTFNISHEVDQQRIIRKVSLLYWIHAREDKALEVFTGSNPHGTFSIKLGWGKFNYEGKAERISLRTFRKTNKVNLNDKQYEKSETIGKLIDFAFGDASIDRRSLFELANLDYVVKK